MRIVFGWAEASWLSVSLAFSYEVPLCSGCPRPRGSFLSSFSPFHLFLIPPFSFSPFFLGPTRLFFALSRLRSCLFSGSRSGIAWRPVLPCAMPYPTTRLTIEENLRRFRSCYRRIWYFAFSHCRNFV